MKKIFTLFAAAMLALGASAGEWAAPAEGPIAAGTVLVDNATLKATTVYEANIGEYAGSLNGVDYTNTMNVRIDKAPNADNPYGTEKAGSTSVIIEVKQATDVTFFFRRQYKDGYNVNDGKDMILYNADLQAITDAVITVVEETVEGSYANCTEKFSLVPGQYLLAARGTTLGLFCFDFTESEEPAPGADGVWAAPAEGPVAAGTVLVDDAVLKATTVYEANVGEYAGSLNGVDYTNTLNVRIDKAPNADNPYGTEKAGSTPIIIEVKQAADVTFFFRRQYKDGYNVNDGKDMILYNADHQAITDAAITVVEETVEGSYANCTEKFHLEPGEYTLAARGTTLGLFAFFYSTETTSVSDIITDANAEAVYYNLNGVRVANPEHGLYIKVQGGKASKVIIK